MPMGDNIKLGRIGIVGENRQLKERIRELEDRLFAIGEMEHAPCFCCGYNGPNYFQPDVHPCAARHHAAMEGE